MDADDYKEISLRLKQYDESFGYVKEALEKMDKFSSLKEVIANKYCKDDETYREWMAPRLWNPCPLGTDNTCFDMEDLIPHLKEMWKFYQGLHR